MSEWKTYKLGDLVEINKNSINKNYSFDEIEYLDTSSVTQNRFSELQRLKLSEAPSRAKRVVNENDIVYSTVRPILRHYGIAKNINPNTVASTGFAVLTAKKIDPNFLYYYLTTDEIVHFLNGVAEANTTTFPAFNASLFENIEVTIPDSIPTQRQIAQILSSLDDKIELNLQMNQTLEAMAQAIFKEWFVHFNFPGFDGELVEGLPKGWRMGKVKDVYNTTSGGTPSRTKPEFYENGTINWVKSKELNGSFIFETEEKITEDAVKKSSAKLIPRHSILLAMYGATVGEYAITTKETTCNQAICAVIENGTFPFTYFFEYFKMNRNGIIGRASGSAQQNISQALIQQLEILIPSNEVVKAYHSVVKSLFVKIENNIFDNQSLTQLRDTLLPKLMSGQIAISE